MSPRYADFRAGEHSRKSGKSGKSGGRRVQLGQLALLAEADGQRWDRVGLI
jgi:hypothetical protein